MAVDLADTNITINISLSAAPVARAGFGKVLLLSPEAVIAAPALTAEYSTSAEVAAAVSSGEITARLQTALNLALSQSPRPSVVKVGEITAAPGAATIANDIAAIRLVDDDWYGCVIDLVGEATTAAENATLAAAGVAIEAIAPGKILFQVSNDDDMYNGGVATDPASIEQAAAHERSPVIYEQWIGNPATTVQWGGYAAAARWCAFDPDVRSAPFDAQVTGILPAQTTNIAPVDLTTAEINAIIAKYGNAFVAYGSAPAFLTPGTNPVNRQLHEILSADWLTARIREDLASQKVALSARGQKWPLNNSGINIGASIINARLQQGVTAEHFDQFSAATGSVDVDTKTIAWTARAKVLNSASYFTVNIAFTADDVDA